MYLDTPRLFLVILSLIATETYIRESYKHHRLLYNYFIELFHDGFVVPTYCWHACSGWGQTVFGGQLSNVLLEVAIPIWEHDQCVAAFSQTIFKTNLCAASYEGGKDSCLVSEAAA